MSPALTSTELAAMREDAVDALLDVCTIRRRSAAGAPFADVPGAVDIACRFVPSTGGRPEETGGVAASVDADATLRVAHGVDVRRLDRVRVSGVAGEVLAEVLYVAPSVRAHRNALLRVIESAD